MRQINNFIRGKSLRWKLIFRFFIILMFLLIIMEVFQYETLKKYLYQSKEQILDARFHNMDIKTLSNIKTSKDVHENANRLINMTIDINMGAAIIDVNGNVITSKVVKSNNSYDLDDSIDLGRKIDEPVSSPSLSQQEYRNLLKQIGSLEGYRLVKDKSGNLQIVGFRKIGNINSPVGIIQLSLSAKPIQDLVDRQIYIYVIASALILIIGAIIGAKVFKDALNPLYKMKNTVEHIDVEKLNKRLPVDNGQIEIDSLSIAFNNMLERIQTSFNKEQAIREQMRQFLSDASHELRTPLTSIHGFVEVLLRGAAKNEKQLDLALNSILLESDRLTKLVNDLLTLNRLDRNTEEEMDLQDLSNIVNEISPQLKILAKERSVNLNLKENINVIVNQNHIKQIIFNLVQNAVRHTDEKKGEITISVDKVSVSSEDYAVIKVKDNGTGISEENINKIFDRFFMSETHRARTQGGYGLGLSIVKSIVDAHNGKIEVNSELGKGTTFSVYIKLVK
ncbi:HAMP domain-containing histidine kinase [Clostridium sp. 19966]|uniref:sensor histidine kinase n=1 Tax=Clostridium sp. 19966 TaxID=2768166 RepID=UPI0028DF66DE|nr:HAMP domain-containing sensor histidine kinase [Clostridium sp. 19966]MDT8718480.1 HAMP domain-containing histidine kinase [Clostridium sp. 19966]